MVQYKSIMFIVVIGLAVIVSGCVNSTEPNQKSSIPPKNTIEFPSQDQVAAVKLEESKFVGTWNGILGTPSDYMTLVFNKDRSCYLDIRHQNQGTKYTFTSCDIPVSISIDANGTATTRNSLKFKTDGNIVWSFSYRFIDNDNLIITYGGNFVVETGLGIEKQGDLQFKREKII